MDFTPSQIIPATNWCAIYGTVEKHVLVPLVCWALGGEKAQPFRTIIHGMVADQGVIIPAPSLPNFVGYDIGMDDLEVEFDSDVN